MLRRVCHLSPFVKPIVGSVTLPLSRCMPTPLGKVLAAGPGPSARPSFRELYERLRRALQVEMDAAPPTIAPGGAYETLDDMDGDDVGEDGGYL